MSLFTFAERVLSLNTVMRLNNHKHCEGDNQKVDKYIDKHSIFDYNGCMICCSFFYCNTKTAEIHAAD